ncbi:MAG TPA: hypothetical protein VE261_08245, partial [Gaiellaceae bacterium]|nr:hypothetical protein [Gaiellaceae bacterium]
DLMRRYGLYDATRGLTTLTAVGVAGVLLWLATRVGQHTDGRFWAEMGIVAGAGLVLALSQLVGGWTKGLRLRLSPGTFALGFLPVLVVVGWILMASQPGSGWHEGRIVSWSSSIGILGLVHDLGLWNGVLAFGFGLVLGLSFDTVPLAMVTPVPQRTAVTPAAGPADRRAADEPLTAERRAAARARPHEVTVGPHSDAQTERRTPSTMD